MPLCPAPSRRCSCARQDTAGRHPDPANGGTFNFSPGNIPELNASDLRKHAENPASDQAGPPIRRARHLREDRKKLLEMQKLWDEEEHQERLKEVGDEEAKIAVGFKVIEANMEELRKISQRNRRNDWGCSTAYSIVRRPDNGIDGIDDTKRSLIGSSLLFLTRATQKRSLQARHSETGITMSISSSSTNTTASRRITNVSKLFPMCLDHDSYTSRTGCAPSRHRCHLTLDTCSSAVIDVLANCFADNVRFSRERNRTSRSHALLNEQLIQRLFRGRQVGRIPVRSRADELMV